MKKLGLLIGVVAILLFMGRSPAYAISAVDVVQAPTGYFTPTDALKLSSPYYRWYNEDWGWTHSGAPFAGITINSATLNISAFDVDWPSGQVDNIYAYDNGVKTLLGSLTGQNNQWSYSTFVLSSSFFDDIQNGLQVWIDIDSTHNTDTWAVSLAKSSLEVNGNPIPGPGLPDGGSTMLLLGVAATGLGILKRRLSK